MWRTNINQNNYITVSGINNTGNNTQDNSINGFGAAARSKYLRDKYVIDVSRFVRLDIDNEAHTRT